MSHSVTGIHPQVFSFLSELRENNDRDWFNDHKEQYRQAHQHMIAFADALIDRLGQHDELEPVTGKKSLFRIYRDVRFSKDKSPYKVHFAGRMTRATRLRRGGYYFHIKPGDTFIASGFWAPESADLRRIREEIAADDRPLRRLLADSGFRKYWGEIEGDELKTAPQGFPRDHAAIDLLRKKQFIAVRRFSDSEARDPGFADQIVASFKALRPFLDYMSEVLTTDANGEPLYE